MQPLIFPAVPVLGDDTPDRIGEHPGSTRIVLADIPGECFGVLGVRLLGMFPDQPLEQVVIESPGRRHGLEPLVVRVLSRDYLSSASRPGNVTSWPSRDLHTPVSP